MSPLPQRARLSRPVLLAYGSPAVPLAMLTLPVYIYLPRYYAGQLAMGLGTVGVVLLVARICDAVTDPLVGWLSDRIRTPWGRRKPWVVAAMPLVLAAVWFLLLPPADAGRWHLLGWSLALYLGWTMMIVPLSAWGAEISPDYDERSRIAGYREGLVVVGTLAALILPLLWGAGGASEEGRALPVIATAVLILPPLTVGLLAYGVPKPPALPPRRLSLRRGAVVKRLNRPFRRLIVAYLLNGIANGLPATLFLLYVEHVLGEAPRAGLLLFVYFLCGVLAVPLWMTASRRFGKHRTWAAAMIGACVVFACVPILGQGNFWWFVAVCVLTGIGLGADLTLPSSMQADVADQDTVRSGVQRTGLYFALWSMATKIALALAVGLAFPILELARFEHGGINGGAALTTLVVLYSLVPVGFKAAAIALMWHYPLDARMHAEIRRRIARRAAKIDTAPKPNG